MSYPPSPARPVPRGYPAPLTNPKAVANPALGFARFECVRGRRQQGRREGERSVICGKLPSLRSFEPAAGGLAGRRQPRWGKLAPRAARKENSKQEGSKKESYTQYCAHTVHTQLTGSGHAGATVLRNPAVGFAHFSARKGGPLRG